MDIGPIISYIERHVKFKIIIVLAIGACCFWFGMKYQSSELSKREAQVIYDKTKEMQEYCDSVNSLKRQMTDMEAEHKIRLWQMEKRIDSLDQIIKQYRNERINKKED